MTSEKKRLGAEEMACELIDADADAVDSCDYLEPSEVEKVTHELRITTNIILSRILEALNDANRLKEAGSQ